MDIAVILPAAGASSRYAAAGGLRAKVDEDLGGRSVLLRSVELFVNRDDVGCVIVAGPDDGYEEFIARHGDKLGLVGVKACRGGRSHRWETVRNALKLVPEGCTHVAVHDAARPAAPAALIDRVFAAAEKHDAVVPALDVPDTIKRASPVAAQDKDIDPLDAILGGAGKVNQRMRSVEATISRENLVLVQTPQVFERGLLERAYKQADLSSTDDASLVEKLGEAVVLVEGDPRNIKITRPVDLEMVRLLLGMKGPAERAAHKRF